MKFELAPLPYPKDALEPHLGAETLELHYEKHHRGYLEKLRRQIGDKPEAGSSLEDLIRSQSGDVFNSAAQVWNHAFYWMSMRPDGGGDPDDGLRDLLIRRFGSVDAFRRELAEAANAEFGSGWAWLVQDGRGRLSVRKSSDAENPLQSGFEPLLAIDVWEHAYYLDYRNERERYVEAFLDHLLNWDFVAANLALPSTAEGDESSEEAPSAETRGISSESRERVKSLLSEGLDCEVEVREAGDSSDVRFAPVGSHAGELYLEDTLLSGSGEATGLLERLRRDGVVDLLRRGERVRVTQIATEILPGR